MSEELFRLIFVPDAFREAVGGRAWLAAISKTFSDAFFLMGGAASAIVR